MATYIMPSSVSGRTLGFSFLLSISQARLPFGFDPVNDRELHE